MTAITSALAAMQNALDFDVFADVTPDPIGTDVVGDFVASIAPSPTGGTDPITASACVTFAPARLRDDRNGPRGTVGAGDVMETIDAHRTGSRVCFSVVPKPNTTIAQLASTQVFRVFVNARAAGASRLYTLGASRELLFLVPPLID
jgi:hypothetical protein